MTPHDRTIGALRIRDEFKPVSVPYVSDRDTDSEDSEDDVPLTDITKLEYLRSLSTSHNLLVYVISDDNKLARKLIGSYSVEISGDKTNSEHDDCTEPTLTINAIHTPLHEHAYTDGQGHSELKERRA